MTATLELAPAAQAPLFDATALWGRAAAGVELSVVVPFYNPGAALRSTIERLVACLSEAGIGYEVIAVSDGSTDGSAQTLGGLPGVRVIDNAVNQGKGAALHQGFSAARGAWIGFVDADGDIDPQHLVEYLFVARTGGHALVYADKRHAASASAATGFRKLVSLSYSTMVAGMFRLDVQDTQTGCKIVRRDVLATILPRMQERRFAFDLELFVAAGAAGINDLKAAPVRLEERVAGSTVTTKSIVRTIRDTFVIYRRHRSSHYRTAAVQVAAPAAPRAALRPLAYAA
ncbi:glycosyltransferase family 2 protein [Actinoplanes sp. NPDC051346]|uniref:glycosyltransferase family 2 protein n=1 Tax=Actinoplanes sp. NPDC051346 TaxID=3155048 RepID=UPI00343AD8D5